MLKMMQKKVAFIFPGQGSQSVGMLDAFAENVAVQNTLAQAGEAIGFDLGEMIHQGPAEVLSLTENTQPVMLVSAIAIYRAWLALGGSAPAMLAGHSLGEYTAYVAAGALRFQDAVPLVRFRAQAMQEAVPVGTGSMAAIIGMDKDGVVELCRLSQATTGEIVEAVNFNAPNQIVIAGHRAAVEHASAQAKPAGAKLVAPLAVSAPFHSSLMQPVAVPLKNYLNKLALTQPEIMVINNVDVSSVMTASEICETLVRQAYSPVRWVETIELMAQAGVTHIVECGPGKVLSGMVKRINPDMQVLNMYDLSSMEKVLEEMNA